MKKAIRRYVRNGEIHYWKNGCRHREDGPSFIHPGGYVEYSKHSLFHREDGPSVILSNGTRVFYNNGNYVKTVKP